MPVLKPQFINVAPTSAETEQILAESGLVEVEPLRAGATKKEKLVHELEKRGLGIAQLADHVENQLYSSDEGIKAKALDRVLKLNSILEDDKVNAPQITFVIQGNSGQTNLLSILSPREL